MFKLVVCLQQQSFLSLSNNTAVRARHNEGLCTCVCPNAEETFISSLWQCSVKCELSSLCMILNESKMDLHKCVFPCESEPVWDYTWQGSVGVSFGLLLSLNHSCHIVPAKLT